MNRGGERQTGGELPRFGERDRIYPGTSLLEERNRQRLRLSEALRELDREIEASEGHQFSASMGLLENSYFVFDVNRLNLVYLLREFEQPAVFLKLWESSNRGRFDMFMNEVVRFFHNYLAGTSTLLEHVRELQDTGDEPGEEHGIEDSPLPRFMQDLLAYMLREGLPFTLAELSLGRMGGGVEVESAVALDVNRLRGWERWSEKGREYLDGLGGKARLGDIVNEHSGMSREAVSLLGEVARRQARREPVARAEQGVLEKALRPLKRDPPEGRGSRASPV